MQVVHPSSVPHVARTLSCLCHCCASALPARHACLHLRCPQPSPTPFRPDHHGHTLQTRALQPRRPAPHLRHDLPAPRPRPHVVPRAIDLICVSPGPFCTCPGACPCVLAVPLSHSSPASVTRRAGVDRARSSGRSGSEFGWTWLQRAGRCADSAFVSGLQSR